jgi:hypothetical protein
MIDPKTVLLGIPSHTGNNPCELTGILVNYGHRYFGGMTMPTECSHPSLVRNIIADTFLRSSFAWLVGIDADIVPSEDDFEYLLQTITREIYPEDADIQDGLMPTTQSPRPTRVECVGDSGAKTMADVLVNCEYAYKREPFEPVQFGLGFHRVHRSVFSILQQLKFPDDGRVEVDRELLESILAENHAESRAEAIAKLRKSMTSQAGAARLWQMTHRGRVIHDYYPDGAMLSRLLPVGEWKGEDHGFWTLCMLAGLIPRIETRTRLIHIGRKGYFYEGPDIGGAQ